MAIPFDRQRQLELDAQAEAEAEFELEQEAQQAQSVATPASQYGIQEEDSPYRAGLKSLAGGFGNILNAATLNFGDEIVGGGAGLIDYLGDTSVPLGEHIANRMNQFEGLRQDFKQRNPVTGTFGELAGAVNNPVSIAKAFGPAGSAVGRIAQEVGTGALQGGLYGAGENQNRLENAAIGTAVGGAVGGVAGTIGEGLSALPKIGQRLQQVAMGIKKADIAKAAADTPKGQENLLVKAFKDLQDEGLFKGDNSPEGLEKKLAERALPLNQELRGIIDSEGNVIKSGILEKVDELASKASPLPIKAKEVIKDIKGTQYKIAKNYLQRELNALQETLDKGGTLKDWQMAKEYFQKTSEYGTLTATMKDDIKKALASDFRQYIEDTADRVMPEAAGKVKELNEALSKGIRMGEVVDKNKITAISQDPVEWLKGQFRTSGGYGVPMLLAAGSGVGEYNRSGSVPMALGAAGAGMVLGSQTGKYGLGATMKFLPKLVPIEPEVVTKAVTPFFVRALAKQSAAKTQAQEPKTPIDYFKGGSAGIEKYKAQVGSTEEQLDQLYRDATSNYRNFVAPTGKVDMAKARRWIENNSSALESVPELKSQLSNPESAQRLIDRHFKNETPLSQSEIDSNALREYVAADDQEAIQAMFNGKNPREYTRQMMTYLGKDREAVSGLRRAALSFLKTPDATGVNKYNQYRPILEQGKLFTSSQLKVADFLYGERQDNDNSTLKAISDIARGGFLSTSQGPYIEAIEPIIKSMPPEKVQEKLEEALYNPSLARDLMNKANAKNVTRALEQVFKGDIDNALTKEDMTEDTRPPKPNVVKQEEITGEKSFPDSKELLSPPASGSMKKTSLDMNKFLSSQPPETRARISVESSGNPFAVSPKGAEGLSQLMPTTAKEIAMELGEEYIPAKPGMSEEQQRASIAQNIRFGNYYYDKQLKRFGNPTLAWAAYNAGPARVEQAMKVAGSSTDVNKILSSLPKGVQKETIPYVNEIMKRLNVA